jgi:hypothetical protein
MSKAKELLELMNEESGSMADLGANPTDADGMVDIDAKNEEDEDQDFNTEELSGAILDAIEDLEDIAKDLAAAAEEDPGLDHVDDLLKDDEEPGAHPDDEPPQVEDPGDSEVPGEEPGEEAPPEELHDNPESGEPEEDESTPEEGGHADELQDLQMEIDLKRQELDDLEAKKAELEAAKHGQEAEHEPGA